MASWFPPWSLIFWVTDFLQHLRKESVLQVTKDRRLTPPNTTLSFGRVEVRRTRQLMNRPRRQRVLLDRRRK